jgi:hypothetical protein
VPLRSPILSPGNLASDGLVVVIARVNTHAFPAEAMGHFRRRDDSLAAHRERFRAGGGAATEAGERNLLKQAGNVRAIIPGRHKTDDATVAMIWAAESLKSLPGQRSTTDTVEAHLRQLIEGRVYGKTS